MKPRYMPLYQISVCCILSYFILLLIHDSCWRASNFGVKQFIPTKLTISNNFAVAKTYLHIFPPFGGLDTYPIPSTRHNDKGIGGGVGESSETRILKGFDFF